MNGPELPIGWAWATFSDVATIASDLVDPAQWGHLPHVAPDNIERDTGKLLTCRSVAEDRVKSPNHRFHKGQIVYSKIRPYLNKCVRVGFDGLCSADMYPLDAHIDPGYLHNYILTSAFVSAVSDAAGSRTVLPKTNQEQLANVRVPVAPLPEQHRIVAAIEDHFSRLDAAVALLERVQRNLKRYRASVLKAAVEGRLVPTEADLARAKGTTYEPASVLLTRILDERWRRWKAEVGRGTYREPVAPDTTGLPELPEGWCWARLDTVSDVQLGQQRAPDHAAAEVTFPYVRAANITWSGLDLSDVKRMGFPNPDRYRLAYGDVLLSEASGSPMEAGKPAIWRDEIAGACYQKTLLRVRSFDASRVLPEYLRLVFLNDCWTGKFARHAPGVGIVHLTAERLVAWPIPLPPTQDQQRVVSEVARVESLIEAAGSLVATGSARAVRLRQSILKWAFEGRLADQDPTDEPASVLLERIRGERATGGGVRPGRRGRPPRGAGA